MTCHESVAGHGCGPGAAGHPAAPWGLASGVSHSRRAESAHDDGTGAGCSLSTGIGDGRAKISAQQGIADVEAEPRGAYTGSIGLVSPLAGADFNVIIRTFELRDGQLELGVGGGITVDSVPVLEWQECLHKAAPLVAAAGSVIDQELVDEPAAHEEDLLAYRSLNRSW